VTRKKHSYRSKEDDVAKISTSLYITNFPDSFSAKDLFHSCKLYGHVVDSFIPFKRSKAGKRFGFTRFINVSNVERLVNNLCTIWVGRLKFHANIARFLRSPLNDKIPHANKDAGNKRSRNDVGANAASKPYVHVVKGTQSRIMDSDTSHIIVLDTDCLYDKDLHNSMMGRVKEFASLSNLRIVWIEIEGVPFKLWSNNTFKRIAAKWGELLDIDDQEDTYFHSKRICLITKSDKNISENFKIIFQGKIFWIRANEVPGWVPDFLDESDDESDVKSKGGYPITHDDEFQVVVPESEFEMKRQSNDILAEEPINQTENQSEDPFGIYSLLNKKIVTNGDEGASVQTPTHPPGFTLNVTMNESCTNGENAKSNEPLADQEEN
nr:nucleotide-binding alpha-beta plait domain-containing protein [Tanacetum cinerariifolium]